MRSSDIDKLLVVIAGLLIISWMAISRDFVGESDADVQDSLIVMKEDLSAIRSKLETLERKMNTPAIATASPTNYQMATDLVEFAHATR